MEYQRRRSRPTARPRNAFTAIKGYHDDAYEAINIALTRDEEGNTSDAITLYLTGLKLLEKGLSIPTNGPESVGEQWDQARTMQTKMRKTVQQMKARVDALECESNASSSRQHSSYSSNTVNQLEADANFGDSILNDEESPPSYDESEANAEQVLSIEQGVQIYFLNSHGHVSAPSAPGPLRIFRFLNQESRSNQSQPPAFIQVDDWVYPLIPNQSPALKTLDGSYLFPDVNSPEPDSYIGLILSSNVPSTQRELLEDMLASFAALMVQRQGSTPVPARPRSRPAQSYTQPRAQASPQAIPLGTTGTRQCTAVVVPLDTRKNNTAVVVPIERRHTKGRRSALDDSDEEEEEEKHLSQWSQTVAKGFSLGASGVSSGLVSGASVLSGWVHKGAAKLRQQLRPEDKPAEIDPNYQKGVEYAKKASGVAVKVSKYVVDVVCDISKKVAHDVGPVVRREGEKLLPESWKSSNSEGNDTIDGVIHVAKSGFKGFGTVLVGLEQAAKVLAKNVSDATVETVDYKYGAEAAKLTSDGLATGLNVGLTYTSFRQLGMKALAKRAAVDTGTAAMTDYAAEVEKAKHSKDELVKSSDDGQFSAEKEKDEGSVTNGSPGVQMSKLKDMYQEEM
ncbi:spartin-like isoform X2 [Ptychodera flava]